MLCPLCKKEYEKEQMRSVKMLMVCKNCLCEPMPEVAMKDSCFTVGLNSYCKLLHKELDEMLIDKNSAEEKFDVINNPSHYTADRKIQPIDVIIDWDMGFLDGQVLKYISRYKRKGGCEDLLKAKFYLEKLITSLSS